MHLKLVVTALLMIFAQGAANAHHSFAAEFSVKEQITIKGVVTEIWFRNPHVRYYVQVENNAGEIEHWDTRGSSPSLLVRRGWTKTTVSVGDEVTINGHLGRFDKKLLSIIALELPNGKKLGEGY